MRKVAEHQQTSAATVGSSEFSLSIILNYASIPFDSPSGVPRVTDPGGRVLALQRVGLGEWSLEEKFASEAELDAAVPNGTYRAEVGASTGTLDYVAIPLPATRITNFDALQAWPGLHPEIEWQAISGAIDGDSFSVNIRRPGASSGVFIGKYLPVSSLAPALEDGWQLPMGQPLEGMFSYSSYRGRVGADVRIKFPVRLTGAVAYTYAGQIRTPGMVDGPKDLATMWPRGLVFDAQGNLYFNDIDRVRKISPAGMVSTITVQPPNSGSSVASLRYPSGLAIDAGGVLYLADNKAIKKISPTGEVTLLAGSPTGEWGFRDGVGAAALFSDPAGIAVGRDGTVYVADTSNRVIRKVSPAGVVSTLAGMPEEAGAVDGAGSAARFRQLLGIAIDASGVLYVSDGNLRRITPDGMVTTLPLTAEGGGKFVYSVDQLALDGEGNIYFYGGRVLWRRNSLGVATLVAGYPNSGDSVKDGMGNRASLELKWLAAGPDGQIYFSDRGSIRTIAMKPTASTPRVEEVTPTSIAVAEGSSFFLRVSPATTAVTGYRWRKDKQIIAGETGPLLWLRNPTLTDSARYSVELLNPAGSAQSPDMQVYVGSFSPAQRGRLSNLSVRTFTGDGEQALIVGFAVAGPESSRSRLLVRGIGPALAGFGVTDFAPDPVLTVFRGASALTTNDNWGGTLAISTLAAQVGAFPLLDINSRDAALQMDQIPPSSYSVRVSANSGSGTALAEIYEAANSPLIETSPRLTNLSARAALGGTNDRLTAGFVIGGTSAQSMLIRAVGPGLEQFGLTAALSDPVLELYRGTDLVASNDDWGGEGQIVAIANRVGAFPLTGASSKDAVLALTLDPGAYTAVVRGSSAGIALIEVYEVR